MVGVHKRIIGWRERVAFPQWKIKGIEAKIDTGARTSALHVDNIKKISPTSIRFEVVTSRKDSTKKVPVEAPILRMSRVRTSTGERHTRYVVMAKIKVGPVTRTIETSLVCRKRMLCRMLLGRRALEDYFVVDVTKKYVFGSPKRKKSKAT